MHILGIHAKCQIYLNLNQSLENLDEPLEVEKRNKEKGALLIMKTNVDPDVQVSSYLKTAKVGQQVSKRVVLCLLSSGKAERKTVQIVPFSKKS